MPQLEVSAGPLSYRDTGGPGPVLIFTGGLLMNGTLWHRVVAELSDQYRCITLTLPLGGHSTPMHADADLSLRGIARLVGEFAEALDLPAVTWVQNDWGGAQVLIATGDTSRIGRLVLTSCEAFDNYPPSVARPIVALAHVPGGLRFVTAALRLRWVRRIAGWGSMSKRPVPPEVMDDWFAPATNDPAIRRDLAKYLTADTSKATLLAWADRSADFTGPVLIAWAREDKVMPLEHGRRLAELFPNARLVEIDDSYTLLPQDQPQVLAAAIRTFLEET